MLASSEQQRAVRPDQWREWASAHHNVAPIIHFDRARLQCWSGTNPYMGQPPLDHHLIVLHRGGAKRVERTRGSDRRVVDIALNATSTIESGSAYDWRTEGPIAFAHLFVAPDRFAEIVSRSFDRDPATVGFAEWIGREDPYLTNLFELLISCCDDPDEIMVGEYYLDAILARLASTSDGGEFRQPERIAITPRTVARVRDFIRANMHERLSLADLAEVAGYSRYHFVRAFKLATGVPPYAYLLSERIIAAREQLRETDASIASIAQGVGFATHAQFSARFRDMTGTTPAEYRRRFGRRLSSNNAFGE